MRQLPLLDDLPDSLREVVDTYAWKDLGGDDSLHRVFVRVRSADGYLGHCMSQLGKKAAGRLLDGAQHDGFPGIAP